MNTELKSNFLRSDIGLLGRVFPYWRNIFLSLKEIPSPAFWARLSSAERMAAKGPDRDGKAPARASAAELVRLAASLESGQVDEACAAARRLAVLEPQDAVVRFLNGLALFAAGDFPGCLGELVRSLELDPASDRTKCALVYLYALVRNHQKVLDLARTTGNLAAVNKSWPIGTYLEFAIFQAKVLLADSVPVTAPPRQEDLGAWLPEVSEILAGPRPSGGEVIFIFSDAAYFKQHSVPLILSLIDRQCPQTVHVHIVNPDDEAVALASNLHKRLGGRLRLTTEHVTEERYCGHRVYYSCIRYCRLHQFFAAGTDDYLILDADMLINRAFTFDEVRRAAGGACVLTAAADEPLWNHFLAGFGLYTQHDRGSAAILGAVSGFVMQQIQATRGVWFLDQIALFMAALTSPAPWGALPPETVYDMSHGPDSLVWAVTNDKTAPRFVREQQRLVTAYLA